MEIVIKELGASNTQYVNQCDGTFLVDSILRLQAENGKLSYTVASIPSFYKQYPHDDIDYNAYVGHPDKTIFFAYADGQLAGQIILRKNWNRYAYVEDFAVDVKFRKLGIGKALMSHTVQWAKSKNLAGIMLETQNNNVGACGFYARFGFQLGGFDRLLYKGVNRDTEEIALYWYLIF